LQKILEKGMQQTERLKTFGVNNFKKIPQVNEFLSEEQIEAIEVVGNVLPFKINTYVINELIEWENVPSDPIYVLTFPQKEMLSTANFNAVRDALRNEMPRAEFKELVNEVRMDLNPHPAGQMEYNVPMIEDVKLTGVQHKYRETMLFFPNQGQTCHAYCTFCFRWPQFVGIDELRFAMKESELMIKYLKAHPEITDVLFTGGDPMIMKTKALEKYILPILEEVPTVKTIRFGSKALSYWPYRFTTDRDAGELIDLFKQIVDSGRHVAFMAHFNHPQELKTEALRDAVSAIRSTGAQIRTQSPIMRNINDSSEAWASMWQQQVQLGMIPYYMFLARDTGAQDYFAVPLVKAWNIFKGAYEKVSGVARTVRGPSMSAEPGKIQVLGVTEINGEEVLGLRFIQGRDPKWVHKPFFAKLDESAVWLDDLKPAFGADEFFFEQRYKELTSAKAEAVVEEEEVMA
jgi:KamA family protein